MEIRVDNTDAIQNPASPSALPPSSDPLLVTNSVGCNGNIEFKGIRYSSAAQTLTLETKSASYAGRNLRIDALRGFFLIVMTVDHLPHHPLLRFSRQCFGFVSSAEGFVFLSGLVSAWVYGRVLLKQGAAILRHRTLQRARNIYLAHLLIFTIALLAGHFGGRQIAGPFASLWTAWWHGALLIYQPPLFGILPMYIVFLLFTALMLNQLERGRVWLVLGSSVTLWLAAQWGIGSAPLNPHWLQLGFFNILAWQLLFVAGAFFGYRKAAGLPSPVPASRLLLGVCIALVAILFVLRHQHLLLGVRLIHIHTALDSWRATNHPLRLLNFAAFAYILWSLPGSIDNVLNASSVCRFLRFLGRHSLQVFAWSVLLAYTASSFKTSWASLPSILRAFLAVAAAMSLAFPAWLHERWKIGGTASFPRQDRRISQTPAVPH
jgi:hypothetical protein